MIRLTLIILLVLSSSFNGKYTTSKTISITFSVDDVQEPVNIKDKIVLINAADTAYGVINEQHFLTLPANLPCKEYTVLFIHSKKVLVFDNIETTAFTSDQDMRWDFEVYTNPQKSQLVDLVSNEHKDSLTRQIHYWAFNPMEYGCGTFTYRKIK